MPKTRPGRVVFALMVCVALFVISHNLYRHYADNALISAIEQNDVGGVRILLNRGANPDTVQTINSSGQRDRSALDIAADKSEPIACLLIEHGANIHPKKSVYVTYLDVACRNGQVALARCLLEHGAGPDHTAYAGREAALAYAIGYGKFVKQWKVGNVPHSMPLQEQARRLDVRRQMIALLLAHGARLTLTNAAQLEDAALMRQMLDAGANVNGQESNGQTALHTAAAQGNLPLMRLLLAHGANSNLKNSSGGTALSLAAGYAGNEGNIQAVGLLDAGAGVNAAGANANPPLLNAIFQQRADIARLLLAHGADPNPTRQFDPDTSAIAFAVRWLPALVPDLVAHHADVNGPNAAPLRAAISARRPDLVRYLLAHHADINGANGAPLTTAISTHQPDMARLLLQHGAKIYPARRNVVGAGLSNNPSVVYPGASAIPQPPPAMLPSTLRTAVTDGPECFELLMQAGADITPEKPDILLAAATAGHALLFDRLISLGANVNATDRQGNTALTKASLHAPDGVRTLLEHGANPDAVGAGQTPLIMAAQRGDADNTRLLLAHGANVNICPPYSHTALYFARHRRSAAVIKLLEQAGAKDE